LQKSECGEISEKQDSGGLLFGAVGAGQLEETREVCRFGIVSIDSLCKFPAPVNVLIAALISAALLVIQLCISGTRMVWSLPAYAIIAVAGLLAVFSKRESISSAARWCLIVSGVFFSYIIWRAANSPVEYVARHDLYMVLACLIVYLLTIFNLRDPKLRTMILITLFLLALVEVVIGIRQFRVGDEWMPFGLIRQAGSHRASGTFISSIHLAGFLEAVAPFALALAIWGFKAVWSRLLAGYVAGFCYFGVLITGSRGGWLSSGFSLVVFAAIGLYLLKKSKPSYFAPAVISVVFLMILLPMGAFALMDRNIMISGRLSRMYHSPDPAKKDAYDVRQYSWAAALDQWREAPVMGTGAGTYLFKGRQYRRPELQGDPVHAHSDYLELLAEYGVVGAVGMTAFLLIHIAVGCIGLRKLAKTRIRDHYNADTGICLALQVGALTAVAAYIAHSVVDFNLHLPGNALFFAFIFGILVAPGLHKPQAQLEGGKGFVLLVRVALLGIVLVLSAQCLRRLRPEYLAEKARVSLREKNMDLAGYFARQAIALDDRNPQSLYYLGKSLLVKSEKVSKDQRTETLHKAGQAMDKALELSPDDVIYWIRKGQILDASGKLAEARKAYENAVRLDPNSGMVRIYFSKHLKNAGRMKEAHEQAQLGYLLGKGPVVPLVRSLSVQPWDFQE